MLGHLPCSIPSSTKGPTQTLASVCDTWRVCSSAQVGGGHFCRLDELGGFLIRTRQSAWVDKHLPLVGIRHVWSNSHSCFSLFTGGGWRLRGLEGKAWGRGRHRTMQTPKRVGTHDSAGAAIQDSGHVDVLYRQDYLLTSSKFCSRDRLQKACLGARLFWRSPGGHVDTCSWAIHCPPALHRLVFVFLPFSSGPISWRLLILEPRKGTQPTPPSGRPNVSRLVWSRADLRSAHWVFSHRHQSFFRGHPADTERCYDWKPWLNHRESAFALDSCEFSNTGLRNSGQEPGRFLYWGFF